MDNLENGDTTDTDATPQIKSEDGQHDCSDQQLTSADIVIPQFDPNSDSCAYGGFRQQLMNQEGVLSLIRESEQIEVEEKPAVIRLASRVQNLYVGTGYIDPITGEYHSWLD